MINGTDTIRETLSETASILEIYLGTKEVEDLREFVETRLAEKKLTIMVYGIFNSGKSTLINALLGQHKALVTSRPETKTVIPYEWDGFEIMDTPGIYAPPEFENVTREQLAKSDVVLFVMDSSSIFEERKVYDELLELIAKDKRLMIIVNCKHGFGEIIRIYDRVLENLRSAAVHHNLDPNRHGVPIRMVDAKTGLRGRIENKPALIEASRLAHLEYDLKFMIGKAGFKDVINTVANRFIDALDYAVTAATAGDSDNSLAKILADDTAKLDKEKNQVENALSDARLEAVRRFQRQAKSVLVTRQPEALDQAVRGSFEDIKHAINRELEAAQERLHEFALSRKNLDGALGAFASEVAGSVPRNSEMGNAKVRLDIEAALGMVTNLFGLMVEESPKAFGRFLPYVGLAVQICKFGYDFFSQRKEENQKAEAAQRDVQHWADHINQSALSLNYYFGRAIQESVDEAFKEAEAIVRTRQSDLDDRSKEIALHCGVLSAGREKIRRHLKMHADSPTTDSYQI